VKRITRRRVLAAAVVAVASGKTEAVRAGPPPPGGTLPNSPLPYLGFEGESAIAGPNFTGQGIGAQHAVVSGTVTIRAGWTPNKPLGPSVTMQWLIDGSPLSGYITDGYPFEFSYSWVTTGTADGTHVITLRFIDSEGTVYGAMRSMGLSAIVQNSGAINGVQTVAVTVPPNHHPCSGAADFVTYNGVPNSPNATHDLPTATTGFIPSLNGNVSGRNPANWRADDPAEPRHEEYQVNPYFATTPRGGVFASSVNPQHGPFVDLEVYAHQERRSGFDGGRCNASLDPYINYVPAPDGLHWYGVELGGRVVRVDFNGTVTTVYGRKRDRTKLPYDYQDLSLTEVEYESRGIFVGTKSGFIESGGINDLCFDPRNPNILYLSNMLWNYIVRVDLSQNPPAGMLYAGTAGLPGNEGTPGQAGFVDGNALAQALFNGPSSIIMSDGTGNAGPIGTMYVADFNNHAIRKISADGTTVTTLVGKHPVPDDASLSANPGIYSPSGTVTGFGSIYMSYPLVIRFTSAGNIIVGRTGFMRVSELNIPAQTDRLIGYYAARGPGAGGGAAWAWLDCDKAATCGPRDDIIMVVSVGGYSPNVGDAASDSWRFSLDGSYSTHFVATGVISELPTGAPPIGMFSAGLGHYPWAIAMSRTQARMISSGFANNGAAMMRPQTVNDPVIDPSQEIGWTRITYHWGRYIWRTGTVAGRGGSLFPWGSRPSFWALRGPVGCGHLGLWGSPPRNTFEDLNATYRSDTDLANYIRSGMGGSVPRPEITGNDMRDLIYFIRRSTHAGSWPTPVKPGADHPDKNPPAITGVSAVRVSSTAIKVAWTTDKSTIGFVACGAPSQQSYNPPYNLFSDIESGFSTSHNMTVTGLSTATPTHFSVVAKDVAGNCVHSSDSTVA
jgi:hypothetical protein